MLLDWWSTMRKMVYFTCFASGITRCGYDRRMSNFTSLFMILVLLPLFGQAQKTAIPYQIQERPLPKGSNFARILPEKSGNFTRSKFKPPRPGFDGECVYSDGKSEVFMLFGLAKDYNDTQKTLKVMSMEAETGDATEKQKVYKKDPSYALFVSPKSAFFAWTHGFYYFSAECKSGKKDLDNFMDNFPF